MKAQRKRNMQIILRLNSAEREELRRNVKKTGLSQSTYLRMLIHGYRPREQPPMEYHRLMRELYAIGTNLNQIAARANATGHILAEEYERNYRQMMERVLEIQAGMTLPEKM